MDLNANLHGNWTLENAKARLNQFFQKEKTSAEYKYSQVGPDHNRSGSQNSAAELNPIICVLPQSGSGGRFCLLLCAEIRIFL